jgi:hypothetical protein
MRFLFALIGVAGLAGAAQADLVVNGGFETAGMAGWTVVHTGSFSGQNGTGTAHTGTGYWSMGATSVSDQSDFYQDIATSIGQAYLVSFWAYDIDTASSGTIHVTFGGVDVGPVSGTVAGGTYTQYSATFTATATTTRLESVGWEASQYVVSDDYSVNAIPAPGAVALLGLGGLVASRRRR